MFDGGISEHECIEVAEPSEAAPGADRSALRVVRQELAASYTRYRSIAVRKLRDGDAADDVVQAFALKALDRAGQLRDPAAVHGWLRRLFETTLIDHCRSQTVRAQREVAFDLDRHDCAGQASNGRMDDPERTVLALLPQLKEEYADAILQLDVRGEQPRDVAKKLGITLNNLTVRAHRARCAMRKAIETMPMSPRPPAGFGRSSREPVVRVGHS